MLEIKNIEAVDTYPIRRIILRNNSDLPVSFVGDEDDTTFHVGVFKNLQLIGISTLMQVEKLGFKGKQFQLRGMATLKDYQGQGLGAFLLENVFERLKDKRVDVLWCNARSSAILFYKKYGFEIFGDEFEVPQIGPHFVMFKNI